MWMAGLLGAMALAAPAPAPGPGSEVASGTIYHATLAGDRLLWVETQWERGYEVIHSRRGGHRAVLRRLSHRDPEAPQLITDFAASHGLVVYERADEEDDVGGFFTARREVVVMAGGRTRRLRLCRSRYIDGNPPFEVEAGGRRVALGGRSCRRRGGITVLELSQGGQILRRRHFRVRPYANTFRLAGRFLAIETDRELQVRDVRTGRRVLRVRRARTYFEEWGLARDGTLSLVVDQRGGSRIHFASPGAGRPRPAGPLVRYVTAPASSVDGAATFRTVSPPRTPAARRLVEVVTIDRRGRTRVQARYRGEGTNDAVAALDRRCVVFVRDDARLYAAPLRGAAASPACPG